MVLKWTRTKPEPLKYFEQELNLNPNRYLKRFATLLLPENNSPQTLFFYETARPIEWTWSSSPRFCDEDLFFYFFWFSPPNLRAKSILKEDNIGFRAKSSQDCSRIPNAFGFGCVSVPQKVFVPPPNTLLRRQPVTILFYLQCPNYTVVCDQITNKSSSFLLPNASILGKYRGKPSSRCARF